MEVRASIPWGIDFKKLRLLIPVSIALLGLGLFFVTTPASAVDVPVPAGADKQAAKRSALNATEASSRCFAGAYTYQAPPIGHYNTFSSSAMTFGIYHELMELPLAMYKWADDTWVPYLATEWDIVPPDRLTVHLREGVRWSDGSDFTAQDVQDTFRVLRLMDATIWNYLDRVEISDTHTVNFYMATPSALVERLVLRENIRASSVYGTWAAQVQDLVEMGKDESAPEWQDLRADFEAYRPSELVTSGPYRIDAASITTEAVKLVKNPTAWNAAQAEFECVRIYNGEMPVIAPLVISKAIDYATHGFSPYWETRFISEGFRILRPPTYWGPALYFNHAVYPFNVKGVRQAMAHVIDRAENGEVSLGGSGVAVEYESGFSDVLTPLWMTDVTPLNQYTQSTVSATAILTELGFTQSLTDGVWITDRGERMVYTLTYPAEYGDWSAAAQHAAEQLTTFGISVTTQAVPFWQHPGEVDQGNFQLAIRDWGAGNPHPYFSFEQDFFVNNLYASPGISFPLTQTTDCCGEIDLEQEIYECADGLDEETHKTKVTRIARAFNEVLPILPLWERYGNNPMMVGHRVVGWPEDSAPIYQNSPYEDSFVVMMLLEGTLYPALAHTYVEPDQENTLTYSSTGESSTVVQVSAGAVSETTMLAYAQVEMTTTLPSSLTTSGAIFELTAYRDYRLLSDVTFSEAVTITLNYTDNDIREVKEETLELRSWTGSEWTDAGIRWVNHDLEENFVVFEIEHLSKFALLGERKDYIYLPLVLRTR